MQRNLNHIFHDVDRDGWGAAAMLVAQLGPNDCRLYPTASKNGFAFLETVETAPGDTVRVQRADIRRSQGYGGSRA
jgi:hypothetical protein